jgi:hypothetical protein
MQKINFVWKKEWTFLAGIVLGLRALYAAMGFWITSIGAASPLAESTYALIVPYLRSEPFFRYFINPWFQWDTISYLEISILGYSVGSSAVGYMPLYPVMIRALSVLTLGDHLFAALVISTFFFWIALILFYEVLAELYGPATAWRGVIALVVFPSSFFFLAGYTESLFLCLVLGCWYCARHGRWYWAGVLGGLATLTRLQGIVLTPMLTWMMLAQASGTPEKQVWQQIVQVWQSFQTMLKNRFSSRRLVWLAPFIPLGVFVGYQLWMRFVGYGTVYDNLNTHWKIQTVLPWEGFILFLQRLFTTRFIYSDWIDLFLFIIVLGASLVGLRLLDPSFSIYIWLTIAILFMRGTPPHLLASFSRYFLALFPVFILFAMLRGRVVRLFALVVSFFLQLLLAWVFLIGSWVA